MQLIPAIDLMNGKIVRLTRGEASTVKSYEKEFGTPPQAAKRWFNEGATKLHIIDLDAAFGNTNNYQVIGEIARNVPELSIQVGGGIRSFDTALKLVNMGVSQVLIGTLAFQNPVELIRIRELIHVPDLVVVSLDNENGFVKVHGWTKSNVIIDNKKSVEAKKFEGKKVKRKKVIVKNEYPLTEALSWFDELNFHHFLVTSIGRDGTLFGPDLETLKQAVQYPNARIIAAGGIGSIGDLAALKDIGVEGAVIGKALYEGRFTLKEAISEIGA